MSNVVLDAQAAMREAAAELYRLRAENERVRGIVNAARAEAEKRLAACGETLDPSEASAGGNYDDAYSEGWNAGEASTLKSLIAMLPQQEAK